MEYSPDYSKIAAKYDAARAQYPIEPDPDLARLIDSRGGTRCRVLDLACGTGSYLAVQQAAFGHTSTSFSGIDGSPSMLELARKKSNNISFIEGRAEQLPFEDATFDYVACNFAFHHFPDKEAVVGEMTRILAPGGILRIHNMHPEKMPQWWVYAFFPGTLSTDENRFWSTTKLWNYLEERGFRVRVHGVYSLNRFPISELPGLAESRDISQLALLPDEEYARALQRLQERAASGPQQLVFDENAVVTCTATAVDTDQMAG